MPTYQSRNDALTGIEPEINDEIARILTFVPKVGKAIAAYLLFPEGINGSACSGRSQTWHRIGVAPKAILVRDCWSLTPWQNVLHTIAGQGLGLVWTIAGSAHLQIG